MNIKSQNPSHATFPSGQSPENEEAVASSCLNVATALVTQPLSSLQTVLNYEV